MAAEVAEHPAALVTVTELPDVVLTVMACVVAPLLHNQVLPAEAVNTTLLPWQNVVVPPAVIFAAGIGFTVTVVAGEVLTQPPACVTCTV